MTSKNFLILPIVISFIGHALLISATGLVDIRLARQKQEEAVTVNLETADILKEKKGVNIEQAFPPLPLTAPEASDEPAEETVALDSHDEKYEAYLKKIKKKIESIWSYPRGASEQKRGGTNVVKFTLDKSGKLLASRITKPSGFSPLDLETMNAVRAAAPYEPFPGNVNFSRLHIIATFHYNVIR